MTDPLNLTARDLAAAFREGRLTSEAIAEAFSARLAEQEPRIHAFIHLAQNSRPVPSSGPLAGVPFGTKDVFDTADMPTAYGSAAWHGWQPKTDAAAVHAVRGAGAWLLGKTVSTEFATYAAGDTRNPWDPSRTPGGSSSGTAAALAAGEILLGFGTQTAGSTIRPASFCGVVAMKPSRRLINTTGMKPLAHSLDVVGPMARNARDLALLTSVAMRRSDLAGVTLDTLPRLGLFAPETDGVDCAASQAVLERAALTLGQVTARGKPAWWDALAEAHTDVFHWEAWAALAPERERMSDQLKPGTLEFFGRMKGASYDKRQKGTKTRDAALARLDELYGDCDLLLTQAAAGEAPVGLEPTGNPAYNTRWTLLGLPSVTIPFGLGPNGMPIGIQIVARPGQDAMLLAATILIEDRLANKREWPRMQG